MTWELNGGADVHKNNCRGKNEGMGKDQWEEECPGLPGEVLEGFWTKT